MTGQQVVRGDAEIPANRAGARVILSLIGHSRCHNEQPATGPDEEGYDSESIIFSFRFLITFLNVLELVNNEKIAFISGESFCL